MNILIIANGFCFLGIAIQMLILKQKMEKHGQKTLISKEVFLIAVAYALLAGMVILWTIKLVAFKPGDLALFLLLLQVLQIILLSSSAKKFSDDRLLAISMYAYLATIALSVLFIYRPSIILSALSALFMILFALRLKQSTSHLLLILSAAGYTILNLLVQIVVSYSVSAFLGLSIAATLVWGILFRTMSKISKEKSHHPQKEPESSKKFLYFRLLVVAVAFGVFALLSTINLHEISHLIVAKAQNCEVRIILYEEGSYPHTESVCAQDAQQARALVAGIVIPLIFSALIFLIGGLLAKEISLLIAGFNLIASSSDIKMLNLSENIAAASVIIGVIFLVAGIFWLMRTKVEHEHNGLRLS